MSTLSFKTSTVLFKFTSLPLYVILISFVLLIVSPLQHQLTSKKFPILCLKSPSSVNRVRVTHKPWPLCVRSPSWRATPPGSTTCSWCSKMSRRGSTSAPPCPPQQEQRRRASLGCTSMDHWRLKVKTGSHQPKIGFGRL